MKRHNTHHDNLFKNSESRWHVKRLIFSCCTESNPALRTPHYYGQLSLSLGKESPYIFSKVNPLNTDTSLLRTCSLLCPWGKKALTFSPKSTRLMRTPHYYEQFAVSLGKESPYILYMETR